MVVEDIIKKVLLPENSVYGFEKEGKALELFNKMAKAEKITMEMVIEYEKALMAQMLIVRGIELDSLFKKAVMLGMEIESERDVLD